MGADLERLLAPAALIRARPLVPAHRLVPAMHPVLLQPVPALLLLHGAFADEQ
jgi:hypothetical protein